MADEQYSLSNLRDIVIPDAPPLWPLADGIWVVLAMASVVLLLLGRRLYLSKRNNAYRKSGLKLLHAADSTHDVSLALKRIALTVFPRAQVASLYGDEWAAFLHKSCPRRYFLAMASSETDTQADSDMLELAAIWIRFHQVPDGSHANGVQ